MHIGFLPIKDTIQVPLSRINFTTFHLTRPYTKELSVITLSLLLEFYLQLLTTQEFPFSSLLQVTSLVHQLSLITIVFVILI